VVNPRIWSPDAAFWKNRSPLPHLCKCCAEANLRLSIPAVNVETHIAGAEITNSESSLSYAITGHVADWSGNVTAAYS
jgi:hypothetical protein